MATSDRKQELINKLYDAVVNMDDGAVRELSQSVVEEGIDAYDALNLGLAAAMEKVGSFYTSGVYFVPELLLCADALYAGLDILRPHIETAGHDKKHQIIIGTVEGDIHDIGKNLVRTMFEAAGWVVHDLGADVQLQRFATEQSMIHADVVALSALMTTSMLAIPKAIEMIRAVDKNVAIMVGGAPLTQEIAVSYGADGYASDAGRAVQEANGMLERLKK